MLNHLKPLSLYVHIPWCVKKCPYCDFNSHEIKKSIDEQKYLNALLEDFNHDLELVAGRTLSSLFFGGGTPSVLSADFYAKLIEKISDSIELDPGIEISLEANPGTADAGFFKGYKQAGINRLSLGYQSLENSQLKQLGRVHDAKQAMSAFEMAKDAGFENINIDLMFGLPGQTIDFALHDLATVVDLQPDHISWYQLTLEPNTAFYAQPPANMPGDDLAWLMQNKGMDFLAQNGFERYEISAYAKQGRQCRHNLNYWLYHDYLGIGAGAHGKFVDANGDIVRTTKKRHPDRYLSGDYRSKQVSLNQSDIIAEFFINRFRLFSPFTLAEYSQGTGLPGELIIDQLEIACEKEFLNKSDIYFNVTDRGHQFLNDLVSLFL